MNEFHGETLVIMLTLVGLVIIIAALLSGIIERTGFPQVAVFLVMGAILGPAGLGVFTVTLDSPLLRVVATLSLALVLFTDAISLNLSEVRQSSRMTLLILGPGTLLSAFLIALLGWWLLKLPPAAAALLGAALASTDPVLLRGILRRKDVPTRSRQVLRLESGLNDVVLLPIVLIAMTFLQQPEPLNSQTWARLFLDLFILGPGAGILVGICGIGTLVLIRQRVGIRRDYEALYSLGIAFTAFAAAEAVHGSGFLAVFAAGLTITALDVELCDCFLEYGETTAEMTLLFTFVLLGTSLIWSGITILGLPLIVFALLALLVRPVASLLALIPVRLLPKERWLIAWFGPRGLSSLLLVLLPVFAGIGGSDQLFMICSVVVLLSILVHGASPFMMSRQAESAAADAVPVETEEPVAPTPLIVPHGRRNGREQTTQDVADPVVITLDEVQRLQQQGSTVIFLDVRKPRSYDSSEHQIQGAVRMLPDIVDRQAQDLQLPRQTWLVAYCSCPNDETSVRVARELQRADWPFARALHGGWNAWLQAGLPVEPRDTVSVVGTVSE